MGRRGRRAGHRRQHGRRARHGPGPGDVAISIGTSGTVYAVSDTPTADADGGGRRLRRRDRPLPPARVHPERHQGDRRVARLLGVDHDELDRLALASRPAPAARPAAVPRRRAHARTVPTPPACWPGCARTSPASSWPGPRSRAWCAGCSTASTRSARLVPSRRRPAAARGRRARGRPPTASCSPTWPVAPSSVPAERRARGRRRVRAGRRRARTSARPSGGAAWATGRRHGGRARPGRVGRRRRARRLRRPPRRRGVTDPFARSSASRRDGDASPRSGRPDAGWPSAAHPDEGGDEAPDAGDQPGLRPRRDGASCGRPDRRPPPRRRPPARRRRPRPPRPARRRGPGGGSAVRSSTTRPRSPSTLLPARPSRRCSSWSAGSARCWSTTRRTCSTCCCSEPHAVLVPARAAARGRRQHGEPDGGRRRGRRAPPVEDVRDLWSTPLNQLGEPSTELAAPRRRPQPVGPGRRRLDRRSPDGEPEAGSGRAAPPRARRARASSASRSHP